MPYPNKISLRASSGQYVCAEGGGGQPLVANRAAIGAWETFTLIDRGNGQIALQACNGQFVCAEGGGGQVVIANRSAIGAWETFTLIDRGNGQLSLKACNGQFVCAEGGGGQALVANRVAIGAWETFTLIDQAGLIPGRSGQYDWSTQRVLPQPGCGAVVFTALASNDVHVAISPAPGTANPMYEIVIGGWGNGQSVLRRSSQGASVVTVPVGLTARGGDNPLWVAIDSATKTVSVGRGAVGQNVFLSFQDPNFLADARYVAFSSWDTPIIYSGVQCLAQALAFADSPGTAVHLGNPAKLNIVGKLTVTAWVYPLATDGLRDIVARGYTINPSGELFLRIFNGAYQFGSWDGSDHYVAVPMSPGDVGSWVHLAGVYDGTTWSLYRNGKLVGQAGNPVGAVPVAAGWSIGTRGDQIERSFRGYIRGVSIWNTAANAYGLAASMACSLTGSEPGLVGYWPLTDGPGATVVDKTASPAPGSVVRAAFSLTYPPPLPAAPPPPPVVVVPPPDRTGGPSTGGAPPATGDERVDTQLAQLVHDGLPFSIFGVPFKMPIHFSGDVQTTLTADTADFVGTAHLDSPFAVDVAKLEAKVSRAGDASQAYLRFDLPLALSNLIQAQVQPQVPGGAWAVIDTLLMPYLRAYDTPTVILAAIDSNDDQLGGVVKGINFYKVFKLSDFEPFKSLNSALSVLHFEQRSVVLHVGVGRDDGATTWQADTSLLLNQSLGTDAVVLKSLALSIKPGTGSLEAGAQLQLAIHVSPSETLDVTGGITLKKGDAGASLTIWGALDVADGTWHDPLGLKGLSIKGLGIELGGATVFPFIALGFRGDVFIGDALLHATLAFSFNPADLGSTVLQIASPEGLNLVKLLTSLLPAAFVPSGIFNVALSDLNFYISPQGGSIAGKSYNKGAALSGKLNLWGYHAAVDGLIDYTSGGYLRGSLDRILLSAAGVKFIELSDAAGSGNPSLDIQLNAQKPGARISGKLILLNGFYSETVDVEVSSSGFRLNLSPNANGIYASAQVAFDGSTFAISVSPGFRFGFSLFGQDLSVGVKATVAIRVSAAGLYQSLGFTYSAFGSDHDVGTVSWSAPLYSTDDLKKIFEQFGDQVKKFFTSTLAGAALTAVNWVKDNVVNDAAKVSHLFIAAGADSINVAKGLCSSFGMSAEDAAKTVGNGMEDAARILKDGFGKSASEVGNFCKNAYGASADAVNATLSGVGYTADEVAGVMKDAFGWFPHVDFPFVDSY